MKAVIPLAGKGTRLRPHTHHLPKPLVRVAGRPVLAHLLDELLRFGVTEMVFIVGHLDEVIRRYMAEAYPDLPVHYVVQAVQDGTAGAVKLAEPFADGELLILFADTLFEADLSPARTLSAEWSAVIWTKEVEDYWKYGVVVSDPDGAMTRIVEKPEQPVSRLANIGLYYIRDSALLFEGIDHVLASSPGSSGEYYLTDAFQYMVDRGARIRTAPVDSWHDCGSPEGLLGTNRHLLEGGGAAVSPGARLSDCSLIEPVLVGEDVVAEGSILGPNVTLERGARVVDSRLADTIVGAGARVGGARLDGSLVGAGAVVRGVEGRVNVSDHSVVEATGDFPDEGSARSSDPSVRCSFWGNVLLQNRFGLAFEQGATRVECPRQR